MSESTYYYADANKKPVGPYSLGQLQELATRGVIKPTLCCCYGFPFNILGIIFSTIGLSQIKKSNPRQAGKGMAIAGLICSILSLVLFVVVLALGIAANIFQP